MLKLARKLLEDSHGKYRVVAICTDKRGRVISTATNSYTKSHPKQARLGSLAGEDKKIFLHAEIRALIRARSKPYRLFVARFGKRGETRLAKPCCICDLAINEAGVKLVEYTT